MAREYGKRGVRVNCISTGLIETESEMGAMTPEFRDFVLGLNALPYFGKPYDIASACLFLSSVEASYVTGTTLCVNGGAVSGARDGDDGNARGGGSRRGGAGRAASPRRPCCN